MLVKWGSIIVKGSGKLGGHVFSSGPSGASVHTLARARNQQSRNQMDVRSRFTQLTQGWRNLTESQRESWYQAESEFSRVNRFGDVFFLSGKNLYESLNNERGVIGLAPLVFAPLPSQLGLNRVDDVLFDVSSNQIVISGAFTSGFNYVVVGSQVVSAGTRSFSGKMRIISLNGTNIDGNIITGSSTVSNGWKDVFGERRVGGKVFIGTYSINASGQKTTLSVIPTIIQA